MADKNIGSLPGITSLDSDSLFVAEQQGIAVKVSGLQMTRFANVETDAQVQAAAASAQAAAQSQAAAATSEQAAASSAQEAQDASQAVQDLSVSATSVPNTSPISIEKTVDPETGAVSLAFSIPEGPTGPAGGVDSFNGRTGAVVPAAGDYNPELVGARPRKNLLRNWYFAGGGSQQGGGQLPINQLGATSYPSENSKNRYTIDNWYFAGGGSLNILPNCIEFPSDPTYRYLTTQQTFDLPVDGPYTISALTPDGGLEWRTISKLTNTGLTLSNGMYVYYSNENKIVIRTPQNQAAQLIAVGFEQGDGQTLGYQDGTGAWQLFETPDYLETLQQCQRYLYLQPLQYGSFAGHLSSSATEVFFSVPVGVQMAKTLNISYDSVTIFNESGIIFNTQNGGVFTPSAIMPDGNSVYVRASLGAAVGTANQCVVCQIAGLTITGTD